MATNRVGVSEMNEESGFVGGMCPAMQTLESVISWGRYAEIFSYNDTTETFSLEDVEGEI